MSVSRKSVDLEDVSSESSSVISKNHIYELTEECTDESKTVLQARSGYDPVPLSEINNKAVEEKLPYKEQLIPFNELGEVP